ncbi:MAG TPA: lysylphosphatidylglycerol synthase transmembrane domain-containing protein [Xanthomonadaceae bacterium]|nr:lysylphosphatidylglycerol synthase transmembrane domain-containing protein [Xanthomonadaceae bacterium]
MKRRIWALGALGLGVGLGIPFAIGGTATLLRLQALPAGLWLIALSMIVFAWNANALRLRLLLGGIARPMGQVQAVATVMATEFAICATPAGTGGPVTLVMLLKRHGLNAAQALALYAIDQLMDMLFFVTALVAMSLYWLLVPSRVEAVWQLAPLAALLGTGLILVVLLTRFHRGALLAALFVLRKLRVRRSRRRRLVRAVAEFRRGLTLIGGFSKLRLFGVYAVCVVHWLLRYSVLFVVIRALGLKIGWAYSFLVQMLSLTVGQFTFLPGGSGGAELSATALLTPSLGTAAAAAAVLAWRFATFHWYLIAGAPVFAMQAGRRRAPRSKVAAVVVESPP